MPRQLFLFFILLFLGPSLYAQNWDIDLLKELNLNRNRSLDSFFIVLTNNAAPIAYSVPLFLLVYSMAKRKKVLREKAIYSIQTVLLALTVSTLLKIIVNRPRPFVTYPFLEKLSAGGSGSFPSGHTSDAFALAASLSFAFPRWYVIYPSFAWAAMVGYSRMHLGVHYPSDVAGSMVIATLCAYVTFWLTRRRQRKAIRSEHS